MASKVDQATIVILDVGKNVSKRENEKENETFFDKAKLCTRRIIERKIISQGKNLLAIVLLGSKKTDNTLAADSEGSFRHIDLSVPLQEPTWQMIRDLPESPSKSKGNWFDSLIVAADHFKNGISGLKILNKKIILLTNFEAPSHLESEEEIQQVLSGFKEEGYEVDVIGPDLYPENDKNLDIALARQFVEGTNGATATFEYTMRYLAFHRKKAVNPMPWNVDLTIGPNINIPVSVYLKIKTEPVVKRWSKAIKDPVSNSASSSEAIARTKVHISNEDHSVVDSSLVIKGYLYGQQCIPFADSEKTLLYQSGPKSLSVYGFTSYDNVSWQVLNGEGISYIFGRKNDKKAQKAITCLAQCLSELNMVGIVRRVYNNGNAPRMYALMPIIDSDNLFCLSLVGICFKEDLKSMTFPQTNLKKFECSEKQVDAFKDLIKAMDLMKAYEATEYDDTEAFPVANTFSPTAQYILDCITFRAMNPGKPLPKPREDVQLLLQVPPLIQKRSKEALDNIKELFTLNKIEIVKRNKKTTNGAQYDTTSDEIKEELDDMPKINLGSVIKDNKTLKVGTLDPIRDYENIKIEGTSQKDLACQMSEAIESMILNNIDGDYTKALNAMEHFRGDCVKNDPDNYNNWLKNLKYKLTDLKKQNVVDMISSKGLNLILESENSLSKLKSTEDSEMYEYDTEPQLTGVNISSEINDIFDNM
ncbi:X-ray repair cross-complementing protein 5-like [Aricia agestis]|uniref:X-ray repair cross-complementing protein 5-like n=1 Tax=Aricia agestis TaxID=91739 RepID=UPI001C2026BD|nr:X-ray repair cross-complementing protein 5-like [Aricia agestis]XP_041982215.1 X-ray repair cross-complementing protein 5-like [Aricia agestis]